MTERTYDDLLIARTEKKKQSGRMSVRDEDFVHLDCGIDEECFLRWQLPKDTFDDRCLSSPGDGV